MRVRVSVRMRVGAGECEFKDECKSDCEDECGQGVD